MTDEEKEVFLEHERKLEKQNKKEIIKQGEKKPLQSEKTEEEDVDIELVVHVQSPTEEKDKLPEMQGSSSIQIETKIDTISPWVNILVGSARKEYLAHRELDPGLVQNYKVISIDVYKLVMDNLQSMGILANSIYVSGLGRSPGSHHTISVDAVSDEGVFDTSIQVIFNAQQNTQELYDLLINLGVGQEFGSITVLPASVSEVAHSETIQELLDLMEAGSDETKVPPGQVQEAMKSGLITVQQVVEETKASAQFSFDFICLCIVASLLAGVGLASNSVVVVVASMLVSPIMGPVLAVTFGTMINNPVLTRIGFVSELSALLICALCGMVVGFVFAPYYEEFDWPTEEMYSRGLTKSLLVGLGVALPSGLGVALSVLGNNTSSLVGVAISASLLPPAVNLGMFVAMAIICQSGSCATLFDNFPREKIFGPQMVTYSIPGIGNATQIVEFPKKLDNSDLLNLGFLSFLLCAENIICIYVAGSFMFWVKKVAPLPGKSEFWSVDIQAAREYNQQIHEGGNPDLIENMKNQLQQTLNESQKSNIPDGLQVHGSVKKEISHSRDQPSFSQHGSRQEFFNSLLEKSTKDFKGSFVDHLDSPSVRLRNRKRDGPARKGSSSLLALFEDPSAGPNSKKTQ